MKSGDSALPYPQAAFECYPVIGSLKPTPKRLAGQSPVCYPRSVRARQLPLIVLALAAACAAPEPEPTVLFELEVSAGPYDRHDTLVTFPLEAALLPVRLLETTEGRSIPTPAQYDSTRRELVWIVAGESTSESLRQYRIVAGEDPVGRTGGEVRITESQDFELLVRGEPVLRYNLNVVRPPDPTMPETLARNAYIHPVWTPSGKWVTDDFHPDHSHQRGIWMTWTETRFEGRTPDFWNLAEGTGAVRAKSLRESQQGPVFAGLDLLHHHVDLSAPGGEVPVLEDTFQIRAWALGGKSAGFFIFDVNSNQVNIASSPLELPEYHYGGFAVRAPRTWTPGVLEVRTSEGKDRVGADGSRERWVVMEGPLGDGVKAGIAVFSHPENLRAPQPLRMHPEMPYLAFSPQRLGAWEFAPQAKEEFRYRIMVFDGDPPVSLLEAFWNDYASPPEVRVTAAPAASGDGGPEIGR